MKSDDEILEAGGTQEDIANYAHDVGGACGAVYDGTCDHPTCEFNENKSEKRIDWGTFYVSINGRALQNFLNVNNFQPGKFVIVESDQPGKYKILAVTSERQSYE